MNQRAILAAVVLFILIVAGMFIFAYLKRAELTEEVPPVVDQEQIRDESPGLFDRVEAKHFFKDGVHTVAGEIAMPTPCDLLVTNAVVLDGDPDRAVISFSVVNQSGGQCVQTITPQRFKVSFSADENTVIEARYKGESITLNLIEATQDESPDDFELFIKG